MTTLAVLSDLHANLPALEAALDRLDGAAPDAVYHLGDLVGYAPWPEEVIETVLERRIPGVAGNYDTTVAAGHEHCGCRYDDPRQQELSSASYAWTLESVGPDATRWLGTLPFRLDLHPGGGHRPGPRVTLVHGTPTLNTLYWHEDRSDDFARTMISKAGVREGDALVFGHTHRPWQRVVDGVRLINAGSVGRPKDGDPRACVLILRVREEGIDAEHLRVEYDVDRAARAIRASGLPDELATILRTGGRLDEPRLPDAPR